MDLRDRYLWDRSGPPDPEVQKLERMLGTLRFRPVAARRRWIFRAAAAAGILIAASASIHWMMGRNGDLRSVPLAGASLYQLARVEGDVSVRLGESADPVPLSATSECDVPVGTRIRTGAAGRAELQAPGIVRMTILEGTDLRLDAVSADLHRLALDRGGISVFVRPPPFVKARLFQVGTPAGLAVDLGCKYDLSVDGEGTTTIGVTLGCVAFETEEGQAWVPTSHVMTALKGRPFGLPVALYSTDEFRATAQAFDVSMDSKSASGLVDPILRAARASDRATLWHLLASRAPLDACPRILERIEALSTLSAPIDRDAILARDPAALAALRYDLIHW